jgi:hypothetical protein
VANRSVNITKRDSTGKFHPVISDADSEETEGIYYLDWREGTVRKRKSVGRNLAEAVDQKRHLEKELNKRARLVSRSGQGTCSNLGQAGEYLVAADLLNRGFEVTKPLNVNGPHDLHAKCGGRWLTFQVKLGYLNRNTGNLRFPTSSKRIYSDVAVAVDLTDRRVRYFPKNIPELPQELRDASF